MPTLKRTTSDDPDFLLLVRLLDEDLAIRDGNEHAFYAQYNKSDSIKHIVVCYENEIAVACGAFKQYDEGTVEIKRMFVLPEFRGKGIGLLVLNELEKWARENNFSESILETGKKQEEAIRLYEKAGYTCIPNYGQYANAANSVCMKKLLS